MSIKLTKNAANRVKSFLDKRGKGIGIRFAVEKTGCSGLAYKLEYVDDIDTNDVTFYDKEVLVVVSKENLFFLDGTELDFVKEGVNEGFKFNNPNATATCGCGESFYVENGKSDSSS